MRRWLVLLFVCALPLSARSEAISVAAAISLREPLLEISKAYEAASSVKVSLTFGSSGQLMGQVKAGAPIDVFISAAARQMDDLAAAGLVDSTSRRVVAQNILVLIVPADSPDDIKSVEDLALPAMRKLAIGEPKTVPAGQYAEQTLKSLKLLENLRDRIIFAANVRQVLDYVERGEVSAGFVYLTDAKQAGKEVRIVATIDAKLHDPIVYPAAIVQASTRAAAASEFLDFLATPVARSVLQKHGFGTGEGPPPRKAAEK